MDDAGASAHGIGPAASDAPGCSIRTPGSRINRMTASPHGQGIREPPTSRRRHACLGRPQDRVAGRIAGAFRKPADFPPGSDDTSRIEALPSSPDRLSQRQRAATLHSPRM